MLTGMTLRGYSSAAEQRELPSSGGETHAPSQVRADSGRRRSSFLPGTRPSTVGARQALRSLTEQLDLIEMLTAVGPEVREKGTLQEALRALGGMEDELAVRLAELVRACGEGP
jgi:hypothetical protein